jgi:hypothetical protein
MSVHQILGELMKKEPIQYDIQFRIKGNYLSQNLFKETKTGRVFYFADNREKTIGVPVGEGHPEYDRYMQNKKSK